SGYLKANSLDFDIIKPTAEYTYEQMLHDLSVLEEKYPSHLRVESAGKSVQGRDIPVAVIGNSEARFHILIQAAIHGREHMTALLAMAQIEYYLKHGSETFGLDTIESLLDDVCLHILPMANPDGVTISQTQQGNSSLYTMYLRDYELGYTDLKYSDYLSQWKSNAAGVDLNRNFNAGWSSVYSPKNPSYKDYKGKSPESQPETQALVNYTKKYKFDATISYHAYGSLIYWEGSASMNAVTKELALEIAAFTGYPLTGNGGLNAGGYKDWAMDVMSIPSITIEVGTRDCPMPEIEFYSIFERNKNVLAAAARWVKNR
ncbi:MAG TPA: M14 family zinc carboxypeptidase, partial [Clostridia bacterium]|nr:M14 family zinc carboxypeptidase [Clostridia bacterium]